MPAGVVGPLAEQEVLAAVEDRPRILEAADHLFQLELEQVALRGQERVVAGVVGDGPA